MRGFIAALLLGVLVFLAVGCGGRATTPPARRPSSSPRPPRPTRPRRRPTPPRRPTWIRLPTDTTATDTTSTDTTATDTTATDTTTTAAGLTVGCQKVANLSVQFGKALSAAGASGPTDLEKTAKAYEAFAQQVPAEIRGRLRDPGEGLRAVRRSDQGNPLQSRPGTRRGHDREAAPRRRQSLNGQDLTKANADISVWVTKNCSATP